MKTALETAGILLAMALLLAPSLLLAKDAEIKPQQKALRKFERQGNKIIEQVKDESKSKGTNTVYKTGRTFPLMFAPRTKTDKPKAKRNP